MEDGYIETCRKCGKTYGYRISGTVYPGAKEREYAICPYCGTEGYSEMTSQTIYSYKLKEDN